MSIRSLTAVQLGKKIKAGEVTVREAVEASLAQIDSVESEIHSYVTICREEALKRADQVQKMIDAGELTGELRTDIYGGSGKTTGGSRSGHPW